VKLIQESLGSIKEIIIGNNYKKYINQFINIDLNIKKRQADNNFMSSSPRFLLEALGLISIAIISYSLTFDTNNEFSNSIPLLGTIALGAQRLLPCLQQIFANWSSMKSRIISVNLLLDCLKINDIETDYNFDSNINFKKNICFENVSFKYNNKDKYVLKNISFEISKGEKIGIIGTTGSGKSTLSDLLTGLLKPTNGGIFVDGKNINKPENINAWRSLISIVPQSVFLLDSSIKENIAFTGYREKIINDKVIESAKKADINKFIMNLPRQYNSFVGERGIELSGGQKQRIGIARALYNDSKLLVLDEATSALDSDTESKIMKAINKIPDQVTIIIIAHRLSTLKSCDKLIKIEKGEIIKIAPPSYFNI
ncbi:ABC transporter ATP-binding protein/permease, partial [Prochlorococcus sp. AH-736-P10]